MSSTTTEGSALAGLSDAQRAGIVDRLCADLMAARVDHGIAGLMLDCLGLTGDPDVLSHALAARHLRDGLRDGSIDAREVNPAIKVRDGAELLANEYDQEYDEAIAKLATIRPVTA